LQRPSVLCGVARDEKRCEHSAQWHVAHCTSRLVSKVPACLRASPTLLLNVGVPFRVDDLNGRAGQTEGIAESVPGLPVRCGLAINASTITMVWPAAGRAPRRVAHSTPVRPALNGFRSAYSNEKRWERGMSIRVCRTRRQWGALWCLACHRAPTLSARG